MKAFLSRLFGYGLRRSVPPTVPTDEVLPCHILDEAIAMRGYTYMWMFRFEDVLDADKLNDALSQLFGIEGWRRLGGRIRLKPDGKAEIHVPRVFTPKRPAVYFTKDHYAMNMSEHPLASRLPRASDKPALVPNAVEFQDLGIGPGAPRCFDDFIYSDLPQFSLHVVTFADGTLVSVGHSHMTTDLGGLATILSAWSLVLAGRTEDVPPFATYCDDPMDRLCSRQESQRVRYIFSDMILTGWRVLFFALQHLFETWWNLPLETRTICIPGKSMDAMVQEARSQIPRLVDGKISAVNMINPFISEGDVIAALATRITSRALPEGSRSRIMTAMVCNMRTRVPSVYRPNMAYVLNASSSIFMYSTAGRAQTMTLGELALNSRRAIIEQANETQLRALAPLVRAAVLKTGRLPLVGDYNMKLLMISNWSKGRLLEQIDFGPAVLRPAVKNFAGTPGKPVFYHADNGQTSGGFRLPMFIVLGRDKDTNLWLRVNVPRYIWSDLLEILNKVDKS